ncbi:unnamed protein product [Prorocentrum cordatum]|uniref:Uncharacterized protein n=1 Tax=Prorocentrum cordatum TaxID=2364126 RepID=A0ABN9SR50_9DINO|nr:unnamed protein product [Polarella glacialis]
MAQRIGRCTARLRLRSRAVTGPRAAMERRSPTGQRAPAHTSSGASGQAVTQNELEDKFRLVIEQQETRVAQLEAMNKRKDDQLLKLHGRLEEALAVLQAGQKMYSEQQKVLDAQQATVQELKARAGIARAPAQQAGDGEAEDDESDDGEEFEGDAAEEMAALAMRATQLQQQLEQLCGQAAGGRGGGGRPPQPELLAAMQPSEREAAARSFAAQAEQSPQLLAHLQAMMSQKERLQQEQSALQQQLQELHAQARESAQQV